MQFYTVTFVVYQSEFTIQTNDLDKAKIIISRLQGFNGFVKEEYDVEPRIILKSWWF